MDEHALECIVIGAEEYKGLRSGDDRDGLARGFAQEVHQIGGD